MNPSTIYNPRVLSFASHEELVNEIASIEHYPEAIAHMAHKTSNRVVRVSGLDAHNAMLLKQQMLALDGEALVSPAVYLGEQDAVTTDALIFGSLRQLRDLVTRFRRLPLPNIQTLATELETTIAAYELRERPPLTIGGRAFAWGERTYVMATYAIAHADELLSEGHLLDAAEQTDMLDIGFWAGEPGEPAPEQEQAAIIPAIAALAQQSNRPLAVRSSNAATVAAALDAGAQMVTDTWGLRLPDGSRNEPLAALVAVRGVPLVLTCLPHSKSSRDSDLLHTMIADLRGSIAYALEQGIRREQLVIEPAMEPKHSPLQSRALIQRLAEFRSLGLPLLFDPLGAALDYAMAGLNNEAGYTEPAPVFEDFVRADAMLVLAIQNGADIVRVSPSEGDIERSIHTVRAADELLR